VNVVEKRGLQRRWLRKGSTMGACANSARISIVLVLALVTGTAIAQIAEVSLSTAAEPPKHQPAADIRPTTIAGIPGLISMPDDLIPSTPIVVMYRRHC
jgi:hypothetical protein